MVNSSELSDRTVTRAWMMYSCRRPRDFWLLALALLVTTGWTAGQTDSGLNDALRTLLVDSHNRFRAAVSATNMLQMRWNYRLEQLSADWVSQCTFRHQENPSWGENLFRSDFNLDEQAIIYSALDSWNLEEAFFKGDPNCCNAPLNTTLCCSYTQMMWATTRDVGCALKKCPLLTSADINYTNAWFLACYYSPAGNVESVSQPFEEGGTPCSACPFSYSSCENNLCAPSPWCKGNL
ncbi:peptidase inhibitor 16-like [Pomacea canaliculata]|uniref:peptidase inhibitor 16-like n=1 Tax=Pomacea canaliculata TaxID=400727 RepID=UPI000D739CF3|nr:peptidase inhibitor 16-like [Pomacea canaliculata]